MSTSAACAMPRHDMIARRNLLMGACAAAMARPAAAGLPVPPSLTLGFRVVRNGRPVGSHRLSFENDDGGLVVRIVVDIALSFGPIPLYRYRHRARERWENGRVVAFEAETNDNGTNSTVAMRPEGDRLLVESSQAGTYLAPARAQPATHWNRSMLENAFINTQTGEVMRPDIRSAGVEPLPWAPQRRGERLVLSGDVALETWYDPTPAWVGLRFLGSDGSTIQYEIA